MQLYEGLPTITNKIPVEERKGIQHHLLGCIGLHEQTWTVGNFVSTALKIIDEIRARGRVPILVGGTHYYTQSLLFHDVLTQDSSAEAGDSEQWPILQAPTEEILARLQEVDPIMADRWHPKDHRKIRRSLEIWLQTGRKASDIYKEQQARREQSSANENDEDFEQVSYLRIKTLVLWVNAESEVLSKRLDSRVDKMLKSGLLEEVQTLENFAEQQNASGEAVDLSRGIWVAIGYKEFLEYQAALRQGNASEAEISKLLEQAIEKTKAGTRQYAKRQVRWIRIKLYHALDAAGARDQFFMLDGSNLASWEADVSETGMKLADAFLRDDALPDPSSLSPLAAEMLTSKRHDMSARSDLWTRQRCEACNMTAVTESDWSQHLKSRKHRRIISKKAKHHVRPADGATTEPSADEQQNHGIEAEGKIPQV